MKVPATGPLESRRALRERTGAAAAASQRHPATTVADDASSEEPVAAGAEVFSDVFTAPVTDELAVVRERKLSEAAAQTAISHEDLGN